MSDAWIGIVALIAVIEGLVGMGYENPVPVPSLRLQAFDRETRFGDGIWYRLLGCAIQRVDFPAKNRPF